MQAHLSWWASTPSTAEMAAPLRVNFSGTLQNSFDENVQKNPNCVSGLEMWWLKTHWRSSSSPRTALQHWTAHLEIACELCKTFQYKLLPQMLNIIFFQTFYKICIFPTTLSATYFCEKSPPCCTRPQDRTRWALCRQRGWGGPLIITIYIFWWMHSKLGWKCGMISYISGVRSYFLPESCAHRSRGRAATFPTCLPAHRQSRRTPWSARDWTPVWEDFVNQNII